MEGWGRKEISLEHLQKLSIASNEKLVGILSEKVVKSEQVKIS